MGVSKRKCKHCKEYTREFVQLPIGTFCNVEHALLFANESRAKSDEKKRVQEKRKVKIQEKIDRAQTREAKERLKTTSKLRAEAQAAFNKFIRWSQYHDPCISCSRPKLVVEKEQGWKHGGCWDAGHYQSRGAKSQLRFNVFNVNKQCKSCNGGERQSAGKSASVRQGYRKNLIEKYGLDKVEWLENNNEIDLKKNDREHLNRIKKIFNRRARYYQKRRET